MFVGIGLGELVSIIVAILVLFVLGQLLFWKIRRMRMKRKKQVEEKLK